MNFFGFWLGLAVGLSFLVAYWIWLSVKIKGVLKREGVILPELPFISTIRLALSPRRYAAYLDSKRQSYQTLEQKIARWQFVLQHAPVGYLQVDDENRLFWCNHQACQLLGIQEPRITAGTPRLLLQVVRSYELDQLIEQTRSQQVVTQKEWVFHQVLPDPLNPEQPQDLPLRGYGIPLDDDYIGIFIEDCQESVLLTQQRDRWTSDVAHELKTPLTSIRLIAETLQDRVDSEDRVWIDHLLDEIIRMSNLVKDLLDLSKFEVGMSLRLNIETIDLPQVLKAAWSCLEPLAAKKKVKLEYLGPASLTVTGDRSHIYRLLLNLLDNAIKYSPVAQIVLVKIDVCDRSEQQASEQQQPAIAIEVIDAGCGFTEEALPHVFERFYRSDLARARSSFDQGGSGLGLAIAQQIVQAHHGKITAQNHPETGGAWMQVILPIRGQGIGDKF